MSMTRETTAKPFNNEHFVGFINEVTPQFVTAHIPSSQLLSLYHRFGEKYHPGIVGTYVAIEGEEYGFIGRVLELRLSERERLSLTEKSFEKEDFHPVATIELLITFNYFKPEQISKGLDTFPHVGAKVFSCNSVFLQRYLSKFGLDEGDENQSLFDFAVLTTDENVSVEISSQSLFGRHCAIVGTTGGGKSWTLARLVEDTIRRNGKAILIDATGEYKPFDADSKTKTASIGTDSYFRYTGLGIGDLFYLLRPSDRVQRPKLMEAIRSLKMVRLNVGADIVETLRGVTYTIPVENGLVKKTGCPKKAHEVFYFRRIKEIEADNLNFDINNLAKQITQECIYDSDRNHPENFGNMNEGDVSFCASLMSRINNLINTESYQNIFGFNRANGDEQDLTRIIEAFLADPEKRLLRISLENVGFEFQSREILVNAIGRFLLRKARNKEFLQKGSLIVLVDEAHQFLNKTVQDEYYSVQPLDAFDLIAKECRKFGLFICLATQMPRDIPMGTLSQIGTFIVHRLINKYDKESIENACSAANRSALSFLPVLGRGEAILLGVDLPMPISIRVKPPVRKPFSKTPPVIPVTLPP
jgi:hypothetical protein